MGTATLNEIACMHYLFWGLDVFFCHVLVEIEFNQAYQTWIKLRFMIFLVYKMNDYYLLASQQNSRNVLVHHYLFQWCILIWPCFSVAPLWDKWRNLQNYNMYNCGLLSVQHVCGTIPRCVDNQYIIFCFGHRIKFATNVSKPFD